MSIDENAFGAVCRGEGKNSIAVYRRVIEEYETAKGQQPINSGEHGHSPEDCDPRPAGGCAPAQVMGEPFKGSHPTPEDTKTNGVEGAATSSPATQQPVELAQRALKNVAHELRLTRELSEVDAKIMDYHQSNDLGGLGSPIYGYEQQRLEIVGELSHYQAERIKAMSVPKRESGEAADAARYRFLRDHRSYRYGMTQEQPMECGIQWEFQQCKPEEEHLRFDTLIDRDIERQRLSEIEGEQP
jgi:hypothetical protein